MISWPRRAILVFIVMVGCVPATRGQPADEDDPAAYRPGLVAEFSAGGKTYPRLDEDLAFDWGADSPDVRVPVGPFSARWAGHLFVRRADSYRFSFWGTGQVRIRIGKQIALDGRIGAPAKEAAVPAWLISPPIELTFGFHPLTIEFTKAADQARMELFWEAKQFERERIPAWSLVHLPTQDDPDRTQRGAALVRAYRCATCHAIPVPGSALRAPALGRLQGAVSPHWLADYLQHPAAVKNGIRMPDFGLTADEANAVAAFLLSLGSPANLPRSSPGKADNGKKLAERLGCLACHQIGGVGKDALFGGGDLAELL